MKTTRVGLLAFVLCMFIHAAIGQNVAVAEKTTLPNSNLPAGKTTATTSTSGYDKIQVFPSSSVHDYCILALFSDKKQKAECLLSNAAGQVLQRKKVYLLSGINNISWDMSTYTAGVYYLSSEDNKIKVTKL
jgi:hypothetical protein